jgi:hypothetical protein
LAGSFARALVRPQAGSIAASVHRQLVKSGVITSVRFLFAKREVNKCYVDVTSTIPGPERYTYRLSINQKLLICNKKRRLIRNNLNVKDTYKGRLPKASDRLLGGSCFCIEAALLLARVKWLMVLETLAIKL